MYGNVGNHFDAIKENIILVGAVVKPGGNFLFIFSHLRQVKVIACAKNGATAADAKQACQGTGIYIRVAAVEIKRACKRVKRDMVSGAENFDIVHLCRRSLILNGQSLITVK